MNMVIKRHETRSLLWCLIDMCMTLDILDEEDAMSSGRFMYMSYPSILYLEYFLMSQTMHRNTLKTYDNIDIGGAK